MHLDVIMRRVLREEGSIQHKVVFRHWESLNHEMSAEKYVVIYAAVILFIGTWCEGIG